MQHTAASALSLLVHFRRGQPNELASPLTVYPESTKLSCHEVIVAPFLSAYDAAFPATPAAPDIPIEFLHVQCWNGPRKSAADLFPPLSRSTETSAIISKLSSPVWCLVPTETPVNAIVRILDRSHAKQTTQASLPIVIELVVAGSTALVSRQLANFVSIENGQKLLKALHNPAAHPDAVHALIAAASSAGFAEWQALHHARDARGRTPLHVAVMHGDIEMLRKLLLPSAQDLAMPYHGLSLDDNKDSPLHLAALAGRSVVVAALLAAGCGRTGLINERNLDLMSPLHLSVADDAPGSCEVVRLLVQASGLLASL